MPLPARPTAFAAYGTSYFYHTELTLRRKTLSDCGGYDDFPPYAEHSPAEMFLMMDDVGNWHGNTSNNDARFNVLMADGHAKSMTQIGLLDAETLLLDPPSGP